MEKTQEQIGKIFTEANRDAVHIAVLPVVASKELNPSEHIGYLNGKAVSENPIGIVDPFLKETVLVGQKFFMFLYPNTITSLRHLWTHPNVADVTAPSFTVSFSKEESEAWLRNFIENANCPDYDTVIAAALGEPLPSGNEGTYYMIEDYGDGPSLFFGNLDAHSDIPPEFWVHLENLTGKKIPEENKATHFSCSC